jgi:hypothetical protein
MVQVHLDPPKLASATVAETVAISSGVIAQLGEHLPCTQGVGGSIPPGSTTLSPKLDENSVKICDNMVASDLLFNNLESNV